MININKKITAEMATLLEGLIGTEFISFTAENFHFDNTVFGQVEITGSQSTVFVNAVLQVVDYYGAPEDICILDVSTGASISDEKYFTGLSATPIHRNIKEIHVVQEQQELFEHGKKIYNVEITRGIIFVLEDGYEVAFEKTNPFTELIAISRGKNLLQGFTPIDKIAEGFTDECTMSVTRSIDIITH